jgi:uncharacterized membrane protein YfcA
VIDLTAIQIVVLLAAIGLVAFLYSSVGHGGATGYLAIMTLLGITPTLARPGALWMNCVVAAIAAWRFWRAGFFDGRMFAPLAIASVPAAWLGSRLHLEGRTYAILLGLTLAGAGGMLGWGRRENSKTMTNPIRLPMALGTGAALGLLAGLTGIGGGVFLTPLLIFLRWTPAKTAAGVSALFILVNSAAGLIGLGLEALIWQPAFLAGPLIGAAGALVGTYLGVRRWNAATFRRVLAVVLWIAACKLLLTGK